MDWSASLTDAYALAQQWLNDPEIKEWLTIAAALVISLWFACGPATRTVKRASHLFRRKTSPLCDSLCTLLTLPSTDADAEFSVRSGPVLVRELITKTPVVCLHSEDITELLTPREYKLIVAAARRAQKAVFARRRDGSRQQVLERIHSALYQQEYLGQGNNNRIKELSTSR